MVSGQNLMPTQSLVGASRATSDNTASPTEGSTGSSADSFRSGLQSLLISLNAESDGLGPDATEDGGSDLSASSETAGTVPAAASSGTATQAVEWGRGLFPGTPVTDTATTSAHAGVNTALPAWKTSAALSGKQSIESPGSKTAATADARPAEHTRGTHKADSGKKISSETALPASAISSAAHAPVTAVQPAPAQPSAAPPSAPAQETLSASASGLGAALGKTALPQMALAEPGLAETNLAQLGARSAAASLENSGGAKASTGLGTVREPGTQSAQEKSALPGAKGSAAASAVLSNSTPVAALPGQAAALSTAGTKAADARTATGTGGQALQETGGHLRSQATSNAGHTDSGHAESLSPESNIPTDAASRTAVQEPAGRRETAVLPAHSSSANLRAANVASTAADDKADTSTPASPSASSSSHAVAPGSLRAPADASSQATATTPGQPPLPGTGTAAATPMAALASDAPSAAAGVAQADPHLSAAPAVPEKANLRTAAGDVARVSHVAGSAGAGQSGSHVLGEQAGGGQAVAAAQDGSFTFARDLAGQHGPATLAGNQADGSSTGAPTVRDTFAALDSEPGTATPTWVHAGAQQAEAGFHDPTLGWVGVRADSSGGTIHASLVPGSADAAQTLGGQLDGLNAYLAEHHKPVENVTVAAPEAHVAEQAMGQGASQNMQQGSNQNSNQNDGRSTGQGIGAQASVPISAVSSPAVQHESVAVTGGVHISVMA